MIKLGVLSFVLFYVFAQNAYTANNTFYLKTAKESLKTSLYYANTSEVEGTVLIRTPYFGLNSYDRIIQYWNQNAFNVVIQSMTGTGGSSGHFKYLSTHDIKHSLATINWLAKEGHENIVLYGESYDGYLALAGGINNHPNVKAIVAASAPTNPLTDSFTSGGMVEYRLLKYYLDLHKTKRISLNRFKSQIKSALSNQVGPKELDNDFKRDGFNDWDNLIEESKALNFKKRGIIKRLHEISVPVLFMAGEFHDQDATDALLAFEKRKELYSSTGDIPCPSTLAIGPWAHGVQTKLSRSLSLNFVKNSLTKTLSCLYPHQIDYYLHGKNEPIKGKSLYENILNKYEFYGTKEHVEFGFVYKPNDKWMQGLLRVEKTCSPWKPVLTGLNRPFVKVPIEKNLKIRGPIQIDTFITADLSHEIDQSIDFSMDVLIEEKKTGSWRALDGSYNMYRTRKRVLLKEDRTHYAINFSSPYISLDLKSGDTLIISPQRSHDSITSCNHQSSYWIVDQKRPLKVAVPYLK